MHAWSVIFLQVLVKEEETSHTHMVTRASGLKTLTRSVAQKNRKSISCQVMKDAVMKEKVLDLIVKTIRHICAQKFDGMMFHQLHGTAMGTKMAPSYANLFMADLETNMIAELPKKPTLWRRDILVIWPEREELEKVITHLQFSWFLSWNHADLLLCQSWRCRHQLFTTFLMDVLG